MTNLNDNSIVLKPNHDTPFGIYIITSECMEKTVNRKEMLFLL